MGHTTYIYGYIEIEDKHKQHALDVVASFDYDKVFPFRNCFSAPSIGYRSIMMSYADSCKMAGNNEWNEWAARFEQLLEKLEFSSAVTHYDPVESSEFLLIHYFQLEGEIEKLSNSFVYPSN
jgi:hypothetical protein